MDGFPAQKRRGNRRCDREGIGIEDPKALIPIRIDGSVPHFFQDAIQQFSRAGIGVYRVRLLFICISEVNELDGSETEAEWPQVCSA